jgi:hypothetical protein
MIIQEIMGRMIMLTPAMRVKLTPTRIDDVRRYLGKEAAG